MATDSFNIEGNIITAEIDVLTEHKLGKPFSNRVQLVSQST